MIKYINLTLLVSLTMIFLTSSNLFSQEEKNDANYTVLIKFTQRSPQYENPEATLKVIRPDDSEKTISVNQVRQEKTDTEKLLKKELDEWIDKGYIIEHTTVLNPNNNTSVMYFYLVYGGIR